MLYIHIVYTYILKLIFLGNTNKIYIFGIGKSSSDREVANIFKFLEHPRMIL